MTALLLLLACATRAPAELGPPVQDAGGFLIRAGETSMAGMAVVAIEDDSFTLQALTPTGLSLFSIRGDADGTEVSAPSDAMEQVLRRIPFERDLWLLYRLDCETRCRARGGTLTATEDGLRWRGPGGPAVVVHEADRSVLKDRRRRYELVILEEARDGR